MSKEGKFTISEISSAIGMRRDEKTMGRIISEMKKCHPEILSSAVRNGRVFNYKYYMKVPSVVGYSDGNKKLDS